MPLKCEMDTKPKQNWKTLLYCNFQQLVGCFGILETGQKEINKVHKDRGIEHTVLTFFKISILCSPMLHLLKQE